MSNVTDEQFFFATIKQLGGSIDWQLVADECNIVTKGAASKRFSRMKAKYEAGGGKMNESGKDKAKGDDDGGKTSKKKEAKRPATKKRKAEETESAEEAEQEAAVKEEEEA